MYGSAYHQHTLLREKDHASMYPETWPSILILHSQAQHCDFVRTLAICIIITLPYPGGVMMHLCQTRLVRDQDHELPNQLHTDWSSWC